MFVLKFSGIKRNFYKTDVLRKRKYRFQFFMQAVFYLVLTINIVTLIM